MTLVSDLLSGIGGGVQLIDSQIFTTSGTWNKPVAADPDDLAEVIVWGSGGGAIGTAKAGGGACNRQFIRVRNLPSSVSAIVSAASVVTSSEVNGATSEFWNFKAYGGGGALSSNNGAGGGILGPPVGFRGGPPTGGYTDTMRENPGKWGGGAGDDVSWGPKHSDHGGAGGQGHSIWGGAGGEGTSMYGGNGAKSGADAQAPGGGGSFDTGYATSRRNGARGEIRVHIWRGI